MMKKCVNTMVASTIVFFPGGFVNTIATAAPSGFTLPAQGLHLNVQPPINSHHLNAHPVIPHPAGHVQLLIPHTYTYIATTKSKARKQGAVSTGSVHWTCKGNRCTTRTAWARPTAQTCKTLARSVGPIQSYGKRGAMLNATDMRSCNAGIMVAKSKRKRKSNTPFNFNSNLATKAPMVRPRTFARPPVRGSFAPPQGNRRVLNASPPAGGGFAPAIRVPPAIRNHGNAPANLLRHRSGGGFASVRSAGGGRTVTSAQALEMTGLGAGSSGAAAGGGRTVTSTQALEMTGLGAGSSGAAAGGGRTVTSTQALEMTGLGAGSSGAAAGGGRTVTSAQALEMTGLGAGSSGAAAGGGRTVTSAQALEMTGLDAGSSGAAAGSGRTVTSAQALEMTGLGGASAAAGGGRTVISAQALEMTGK